MDEEFSQIENERKNKANSIIQNMIKERELKNKIIEQEIEEFNKFNYEIVNDKKNNSCNFNNINSTSFDNKNIKSNENNSLCDQEKYVKNNYEISNFSTNFEKSNISTNEMNIIYSTNEMKIINSTNEMNIINSTNEMKIYRSTYEISNNFSINNSINLPQESLQNIDNNFFINFSVQLTDFYKINYLNIQKYFQIEKEITDEKNKLNRSEILKIKIEVNKRLNQLNNDYDKIITLSGILSKYNRSYTFIEIFTLKILEQSTVQVSRYIESYKQYSLLFKLLYSDELFIFYKVNMLNKKSNENGLRGIYSVYFGILLECDFIDEMWSFGAGMLNVDMDLKDYNVLEIYIDILAIYLIKKLGNEAKKLFRYIKKYIVNKITSPSQKYKIEQMIDKLI